jgi:signal transduction histidine kinase
MKPSGTPDADEWLVILRADGVVDAVEGGAPVTWLGRKLADAPSTSGTIRRAVAELMHATPTAIARRRKVSCIEGERQVEVELLLVEALPVRRALTSVHELVMRTLDLFMSQAKSNHIDLSFELAENVPPAVFVDSEKIAWAISMLVANALRYAKSHVGVHVRWESAPNDLVITVQDDGAGIPEAQARRLFERDPVTGKAAGLALLMVKDIVASHRGSVAVTSKPGHGSAFTLRIPRLPAG